MGWFLCGLFDIYLFVWSLVSVVCAFDTLVCRAGLLVAETCWMWSYFCFGSKQTSKVYFLFVKCTGSSLLSGALCSTKSRKVSARVHL